MCEQVQKNPPSLSVILPVFNAEKYLVECIDSILAQSFKDYELIILDDGSTDNSKKIIESYNDCRIIFLSRENRGLGTTLNELIELANTELLVRMDADDVMMPNRLYLQNQFMRSNIECVLSGTQIMFYNGRYTLKRTPFPEDDKQIKQDLSKVIFSVCHPSIIFRKSVATCIGGYKLNGVGEDLDFFLRMGDQGKIMNINYVGLLYRYSKNSITATKSHELKKMYAFTLAKRKDSSLLFENFEVSWEKRSKFFKLAMEFQNLGEYFYSNYIINYGIHRLRASAYLLIASIFKIEAVWRHILRRFRYK